MTFKFQVVSIAQCQFCNFDYDGRGCGIPRGRCQEEYTDESHGIVASEKFHGFVHGQFMSGA